MKSKLNRYWGILASALVLTSVAVTEAAQPPSPVFTNGVIGWDCLMTGPNAERGIFYVTFADNGTFTGFLTATRIAAPKAPATDRSGVPSDRSPSDSVGLETQNIYGAGDISGLWSYDAKGYTLGVFTFVVAGTPNQVSFRAKISPNKRLTASYSSSLGGKGTFRGVPVKPVTDLAGLWTAEEKNSGISYYEFFSLTPKPVIWPNIYDLSGDGPGYGVTGVSVVSSQKKIAFASLQGTNATLRATLGSFINKSTSLGGKTKGLSSSGTNNIVTYDAFRVSAPAPE